jgi:ferric-dicitrate binding protein FerR (iron transport regulator)
VNDDENDPIATLVRLAGRRSEVDAERTARVRAAVAGEWHATTRRRRWTRVAVAAAIAATIGGVLLTLPRTESAAPTLTPLVETAKARELTTPNDATTSVEWNGGTLRLDRETHLRIDTARTATLIRGAIYYANDTPGVAVTIHTPFGDVRDVGTRFEIRLRDDALRVRVRDGAAIVRDTTARAGTELVATRTSVMSRTFPTSGEDWAWIENAAPPIVLEGKSLGEVLQRIAIEKGLTLERNGPDPMLHGDVPLSVSEALDAATAAAGVTYRIEGDRLIVRARS